MPPVHPKLFADLPEPLHPAEPLEPPARPFEPAQSDAAPVWLQRISLFILVLFCIYLGAIVTVLPWLPSLWDHNPMLQSHPRLWSVLRLGFVRGIISGLGLLDIWIGISEAIHYSDHRVP